MHHRTKTLAAPWKHQAATEVTAFAVEQYADQPAETQGRAAVVFGGAGFELRLNLTAPELRALSLLLAATADDQETANASAQVAA